MRLRKFFLDQHLTHNVSLKERPSPKFVLAVITLKNPHLPVTIDNLICSKDRDFMEWLETRKVDYECKSCPNSGTAEIYVRNIQGTELRLDNHYF